MNLDAQRKELLDLVIKNAYFKEKIILSSGKESDYYIDARRITLTSEGASLCAQIMLNMVEGTSFDALGGPTLGADPLIGAIAVISLQQNKPLNTFIIRKAPKSHGKQQQIEGPIINEGSSVILIDDVATSGKAFIESIDVLEKLNIKVAKAICIVDRNEGATEAIAQKGVKLESIFNISEIHTS